MGYTSTETDTLLLVEYFGCDLSVQSCISVYVIPSRSPGGETTPCIKYVKVWK